MSSFWDSIGEKLQKGTLQLEELAELLQFLTEMDAINKEVVSKYIAGCFNGGYKFVDYSTLLHDIQNKGISQNQLECIISNLHSFDHIYDQVIMYSIYTDEHYWVKHKSFKLSCGILKDGLYIRN